MNGCPRFLSDSDFHLCSELISSWSFPSLINKKYFLQRRELWLQTHNRNFTFQKYILYSVTAVACMSAYFKWNMFYILLSFSQSLLIIPICSVIYLFIIFELNFYLLLLTLLLLYITGKMLPPFTTCYSCLTLWHWKAKDLRLYWW